MWYNIDGDNMFKKYLNDHKISVYKLSEMSKVPYTTLNELVNGKKNIKDCKIKTIELIANSLKLSIESFLLLFNNNDYLLSDSWNENKNKKFIFPQVIQTDKYDSRRIHPLKQRLVYEVYNKILELNIIEKAIVFGSSVNIRCNTKSDLDIALYIKDDSFNRNNQNIISEEMQELCNYNLDIIWLNNINKDSQLYNNIIKKGVVIYE